jgi:ribonuclease T1
MFKNLITRFLLLFFSLFLGYSSLIGCQAKQPDDKHQASFTEDTKYDNRNSNPEESSRKRKKRNHHKHDSENRYSDNSKEEYQNDNQSLQSGNVPAKALKVFQYVKQHKEAIDGYVGGRTFGNYEGHLPKKDASGKTIDYKEWDVNPKVEGKHRGAERLVTGSDGKAYYTDDHYNTFTEIK